MLGQTEIFDPPPTRRLIKWHGTGWAGVDPSTKRCAIATVDADGERQVRTVSFPTLEGAERLQAIYEGVAELWREVGIGIGVVVVEQPAAPKARSVNPPLYYAVGVTLAAIASVDCLEAPTVEMVTSSSWKKVACGYGAIYKPKPMSQTEYGVLTWARSAGYVGSSWDEADAWGIAEYARKTFALEQR